MKAGKLIQICVITNLDVGIRPDPLHKCPTFNGVHNLNKNKNININISGDGQLRILLKTN